MIPSSSHHRIPQFLRSNRPQRSLLPSWMIESHVTMSLARPNTFHHHHHHPPKSHRNSSFLLLSISKPKPKPKSQISCSSNPYSNNKRRLSDAQLASELAREVKKMNTQFLDTEDAINKSRELLFGELCQFLDLKPEQMKKSWRGMSEEEKWCLVDGFVVSDWSIDFRPLSARCVKGLVDEYVGKEEEEEVEMEMEGGSGLESNPDMGFFTAGLRNLMGLKPNSA
ncbi:hypothetical protein Dimus_026312 [Dionaea muscipula]